MSANTTGTFDDACMKLQRELPGYQIVLSVNASGYSVGLIPPIGSSGPSQTVSGRDPEWSRVAHELIDEVIRRQRGAA